MIYGYARVSPDGQSVESPVAALTAAGAVKGYRDIVSGAKTGIHVKRDNRQSIAYSEELIFPISATLQSTDRHHGIVGQERCHFQRDS